LHNWGGRKLLLRARKGAWWDANKIGLSPPLIETSRGWLMIYHGVRQTAGGAIYRLGLALFDIDDPSRCLMRSDPWVFGPETHYECRGDVANVVFPCGVTTDGHDTLYVYYGAADTCVGLAMARVSTLLEWLERNGRPPSHSSDGD